MCSWRCRRGRRRQGYPRLSRVLHACGHPCIECLGIQAEQKLTHVLANSVHTFLPSAFWFASLARIAQPGSWASFCGVQPSLICLPPNKSVSSSSLAMCGMLGPHQRHVFFQGFLCISPTPTACVFPRLPLHFSNCLVLLSLLLFCFLPSNLCHTIWQFYPRAYRDGQKGLVRFVSRKQTDCQSHCSVGPDHPCCSIELTCRHPLAAWENDMLPSLK